MASRCAVQATRFDYALEEWKNWPTEASLAQKPELRELQVNGSTVNSAAGRPSKRRKVENKQLDPKDRDGHVWLVHRYVELEFGMLLEGRPVLAEAARVWEDVGEISWKVGFELLTGDDDLITMKFSSQEGQQMLELSFRKQDLDTSALTDIEWAAFVRGERFLKKGKQSWLDTLTQECIVHLRHNSRGWYPELEFSVTMLPQNEWSNRTLAFSREWGRLLAHALPTGMPMVDGSEKMTTQDFYVAAHVPDREIEVPEGIQHPVLSCTLMPFQRRSVTWMLAREGVQLDAMGGGKLVAYEPEAEKVPALFSREVDKQGNQCFVSHALGIVSKDLQAIQQTTAMKGGILAEEMGLGKTVETISVIALNQCGSYGSMVLDDHSDEHVMSSRATLIITPKSILKQWQNELKQHAPSMTVYVYEGAKKITSTAEMMDKLTTSDVVLTTYDILSAEYHYAQPLPKRNFRYKKVYEPLRSPLIGIRWWRCCLDEAQMVDGGVSNAALLAHGVPRVNAWAVSGTPVRKTINDLHGLLLFLRYAPFWQKKDLWQRVVQHNRSAFTSLFQEICLRHTKDLVHAEVHLPRQQRVVVTVPFTYVEQTNYKDLYEQMCNECGLSPEGETLNPRDPPDLQRLKHWLVRLRQTCLHPEAGEANRKAFGAGHGPPRSVEKVLDVMIEQLHAQIRADEKSLIASKIKRGQIFEHEDQIETALGLWQSALADVRVIVAECRHALGEAQQRLVARTKEAKAQEKEQAVARKQQAGSGKGKRKASEYDESEDSAEGEVSDSEQDEESGARDEHGFKSPELTGLKVRLRTFLELEHSCLFWIATAYFQLHQKQTGGKPLEDVPDLEQDVRQQVVDYQKMEADYYDQAKKTRLEMMHESRTHALRLMAIVQKKSSSQNFTVIPSIECLGSGRGGIESNSILEMFNSLSETIDAQAELIDEWREELVKHLLLPLVDSEDDSDDRELQGDEFEVSVEHQEKSFALMSAIRAAAADRGYALTAERNTFIEQETAQALVRQNRIHNDIFRELIAKKDAAKPAGDGYTVKSTLGALRSLVDRLKGQAEDGNQRAALELATLAKPYERLRAILKEQTKACADLIKEVDFFRSVTNSRVLYYRQVQDVSSTVEPLDPVEFKKGKTRTVMARMIKAEEKYKTVLEHQRERRRYLDNLKGDNSDDGSTCKICQTPCPNAMLITPCGHTFCRDCLQIWLRKSRACPSCRSQVRVKELRQVTYSKADADGTQKTTPPQSPGSPAAGSPKIYADVNEHMLRELKSIELTQSYGSKIDMITRHLLWLRENEPGFKAVIFSQWSDVLEVVKSALKHAKIGFASLESSSKRGLEAFREDADVSCFFLHGHSRSTGLNLVNATHIFLCEPLVNIPLELQAISRIHRIGQTRETTVWMYTVEGTVEQAILELATARRAALLRADDDDELMLDAADSAHLRQPSTKFLEKSVGGGELVGNDDVWKCLFSRVARAMPAPENDGPVAEGEQDIPAVLPRQFVNAQAGEGSAGPAAG